MATSQEIVVDVQESLTHLGQDSFVVWWIVIKGIRQKKNTIHETGSSNLLVDKTKSIVRLIIFVFTTALKVVLPNNKICVSEKSVLSNSVWSMLTKLFRSVGRSLLYKGQWRKKLIADSTSLPQLHIRFSVSWKLCLDLCSRRWLSPGRIRVIYLILIGLWHWKNELEEGMYLRERNTPANILYWYKYL